MKKSLIEKIHNLKISDLFLLIISAIFLVIFYNYSIIGSRFSLYSGVHGFLSFILEISFNILILIPIFLLFSFNKTVLKIVLILFFLFSTLAFYIFKKFGIILDEIMISNAFGSVGHIEEVMDYSCIFYVFLFLFLATIIVKTEIYKDQILKKIIVGFVCLILVILISLFFPRNDFERLSVIYSPLNYISSSFRYYERFHDQLKQANNRTDLDQFYKFSYDKQLENLNVILIIGESLRADHLGLNGYKRNTTPNLEKIVHLLNFTAAASFNTTTPSVTSILSHRTKEKFLDIPPEKSVISVFKNLGFKSYWYSAQSSKEFGNGMLAIMAHEADDYFFVDRIKTKLKSGEKSYDETLIPYLEKVLANGGNNFIILHSFGSHIRFNERYPESFAIYKPECFSLPDNCTKEEVENSYDNSVLYTDYFISQIIEKIKNTNTILFYISDHGIFLGEDNIYANGNSSQINSEIHRVPMFLYMSNSVLKNKFYGQKFLKASNKTKAKNLSHDNLFDSLIDCSGIKSDLLNRDLSVCSSN